MSDRSRIAFDRRVLDAIDLLPHERERALHAFRRAQHVADVVVALVRLPRLVLRAYQREGGYRHPHPTHE